MEATSRCLRRRSSSCTMPKEKRKPLYFQPPPPPHLLLQLHVHPDILQQVLQVNKCEAREVSVRFVHIHRTHVPLGAHVLSQEVDWLGSPILDANL
ncbi:hypothetical protein E2C01_046946 [Portunus trituberculatus]|uniref:Uncharacterized protein n=1 Tax=Portunus trituberculatus TaxID=210409 RepID=A0A5B7G2A5_PORTR|nr:hypothetical protein [Portunus trituberculatus]